MAAFYSAIEIKKKSSSMSCLSDTSRHSQSVINGMYIMQLKNVNKPWTQTGQKLKL